MVLDTLKAIDFYGNTSHFNTFGKSKHKTHFGGLLSILTILAMINASVYFGNNFFYRLNPNYIFERINQANPIMYEMNNSNLFLAFRIEDDDTAEFFNFSQYFKLNVTYEISNRNQISDPFNLTIYPLEIVDCSSIFDDKVQYSSPNYIKHSCIKLSNIKLGGYWDGNEVNLIKVKLKYCVNDSNCKNISEIKDLFMKKIYDFNLYTFQTFVNLDTNTFEQKTRNIFFNIDPLLSKTKFIYFNTVNFITDYGILSKMPKNISQISLDHEINDFRIIDKSDSETELINLQFYLLSENDEFIINYIKLTEVFANLGGIYSVIQILFMNIAWIYNSYDKNVSLINKIFDFSDLANKVDVVENLMKEKIKHPFYYKSNMSPSKSSIQILDQLEKNVNIIKVDMDVNLEISNKCINEMSDYLGQVIRKQKSIFKISPSFYNFFCRPKIKNKSKKLIFDVYLKAEELITSRLDVVEYFRFFNDYIILKKIMLSDFSNLCLSLKNRPKLFENKNIISAPTKAERLKSLLNNYCTDRNSCTEDKFFNILDDTLKNTLLHLSLNYKEDI